MRTTGGLAAARLSRLATLMTGSMDSGAEETPSRSDADGRRGCQVGRQGLWEVSSDIGTRLF